MFPSSWEGVINQNIVRFEMQSRGQMTRFDRERSGRTQRGSGYQDARTAECEAKSEAEAAAKKAEEATKHRESIERRCSRLGSQWQDLAAQADELERGEASREQGKNPAAVALGKRGGAKGGHARAKNLSAAKRKAIAKKAVASRWSKSKKQA
jgi:hypothetical protein